MKFSKRLSSNTQRKKQQLLLKMYKTKLSSGQIKSQKSKREKNSQKKENKEYKLN